MVEGELWLSWEVWHSFVSCSWREGEKAQLEQLSHIEGELPCSSDHSGSEAVRLQRQRLVCKFVENPEIRTLRNQGNLLTINTL